MFVYLSFRPCSSQRLSPWLQGLRWESRKQWKQDRVRKSLWVLWSFKKRLGCQESPRLCFCWVWRSQRCIWCCERTGWKVMPSAHFLVVVSFFCLFVFFENFHTCAFFCLEPCVAVACVLSYPLEKSALGAVALLHPGIDALVKILGDVVLQSDAGMYFLLKDSF